MGIPQLDYLGDLGRCKYFAGVGAKKCTNRFVTKKGLDQKFSLRMKWLKSIHAVGKFTTCPYRLQDEMLAQSFINHCASIVLLLCSH